VTPKHEHRLVVADLARDRCLVCEAVEIDPPTEVTAIAGAHLGMTIGRKRFVELLCRKHRTLFSSLEHALKQSRIK
jgi:hypothetical protein